MHPKVLSAVEMTMPLNLAAPQECNPRVCECPARALGLIQFYLAIVSAKLPTEQPRGGQLHVKG